MARGKSAEQRSMMAFIDIETRIPAMHPLRSIKRLADAALETLSPTFDAMYAQGGRRSIPPERLLKANLLMALYSVRSERAFCEELEYHLLFRWFLDMDLLEPGFDASTFSKNRQRLLDHAVAQHFFAAVVAAADAQHLLSDEHFSVDGTMIEAAASSKSFRPRDGSPAPMSEDDDPSNPTVNFRKERRSNATHLSTTDGESRMYRKGTGQPAKLAFLGLAVMENRHGLLVDLTISEATQTAERTIALTQLDALIARGKPPRSVGADKGYDTIDFIKQLREREIEPHVALNEYETTQWTRTSTVGHELAHTERYQTSQRLRKRIEEIFGWMKTTGGFRRTRYRGIARTQLSAYLVGATYNLLRMSRLLPARDH